MNFDKASDAASRFFCLFLLRKKRTRRAITRVNTTIEIPTAIPTVWEEVLLEEGDASKRKIIIF